MVMALAVASPSTSSGLHISWPSGPVIPSSIIFSDCYRERERERVRERERERERERGGGGGGVYVSSGSSSKVKTYSCNDVSILSMDLCQSSKLLAADEGLHQLHNT